MSKKLLLTESELAKKTELTNEYEQRFVQVREAVESEKNRHATLIQELGDKVAAKESELGKLEERVMAMNEERSGLLGKQKELHWEKDQESKRMTKEIARLNERAELERADHLQLIEKLKADIKDRYT